MKRIVVASENPVKVQATLDGFKAMFPEEEFCIQGVKVASGVSDQPKSDAETLQGALNRADSARQLVVDADYWVGIEGGIDPLGQDLLAFAWMVVMRPNITGKARTGAFVLPRAVTQLIKAGKELGEADDIVFNRYNSKQENGAVGLLTGDLMDRAKFYTPGIILALIPFRNPDLY